MKQTPTYGYDGGPLAGQVHSKSAPGRWPTYRDENGEPVQTSKIETYRIEGTTRFRLYLRTITPGVDNPHREGATTYTYTWKG